MKLLAAHYRTGETFEFVFDRERLNSRAPRRGRTDLVFGPGFLDLQCNGYAGVDFNRPDVAPEQIVEAIRAMWAHGCTDVLPTLITASVERLVSLFERLGAALEIDRDVARCVPGFHLEGPFLSEVDGARGAHPREHVIPPDRTVWRRLQRAAGGRIRLVTLAPETKRALAFIRHLRTEGVLPAIGHTMAEAADIAAACEAGALMSTHLGNGCPQMLHRHHNPVLAQLGEDRLAASFITDGIHLPPALLRAYWRAKAGRAVIVTDAMAAAGAPPGRYTIGDLTVEVGRDRVVRQPGQPQFAGSALTMCDAVANVAAFCGIPLGDAWDAASTAPRALLAKTGTRIPPNSLVFARHAAGALQIQRVVRAGKTLWQQ